MRPIDIIENVLVRMLINMNYLIMLRLIFSVVHVLFLIDKEYILDFVNWVIIMVSVFLLSGIIFIVTDIDFFEDF